MQRGELAATLLCEQPLGKRKRQQAAQLNIGDWSGQKYDTAEAGTGGVSIERAEDSELKECPSSIQNSQSQNLERPVISSKSSPGQSTSPGISASRRLAALLRLSGSRPPRQRARRSRRQEVSEESHSSSDEDSGTGALNPMRLLHERSRASTSKAARSRAWDEPMQSIDDNMGWATIGGRQEQISALKECTLHPLLYPELYKELGIKPPLGVLLHGPPGCGKTLAARALTGACKEAGLPVTFYARRGGDIQSKFVGEAEQRLCDLFEAAKRSAPAVIFFDELDGLAPSRNEAGSEGGTSHHNGVVATLLALMDGLVERGQVVVLAATNRPDLLDPALRRPGRFDRELHFGLPDADERLKIMQLHTKTWPACCRDPGTGGASLINLQRLATQFTNGLSGADLSALCAESAVCCVRRTFPQIYAEGKKLKVNARELQVTRDDFAAALATVATPAARARGASAASAPLGSELTPLLEPALRQIQRKIAQAFPPWGGSARKQSGEKPASLALLGARLLISSPDPQLLRILEPALCCGSELPVYCLDTPDGHRLMDTVAAAVSAAPSVLLVRGVECWAEQLLTDIFADLPMDAPLLVLGTYRSSIMSLLSSEASAPSGVARKINTLKGTDVTENASKQKLGRSRRKRRRVVESECCDHESENGGGKEEPGGAIPAQMEALFEEILVAQMPSLDETRAFFEGLLQQGIRQMLRQVLDEQAVQPKLPSAELHPLQDEALLSVRPEDLAKEEQEELYWQRHFRSQVGQVLRSLLRYTRFAPFSVPREELLEVLSGAGPAAPETSLEESQGPLTIPEIMQRNSANGYASVDEVREDFRQLLSNAKLICGELSGKFAVPLIAHAQELVDKAELKLDCIDEGVVRMLGTMQARRQRRQAALERRESSPSEPQPSGQGVAPKCVATVASRGNEDCEDKVLPPAITEVVEHGTKFLIETFSASGMAGPWMQGSSDRGWLTFVLKLGRTLQQEIYKSTAPCKDLQGQPKQLLKQLLSAFTESYVLPDASANYTAASLGAHRASAFLRWARSRKGGTQVRQLACQAVAALLHPSWPQDSAGLSAIELAAQLEIRVRRLP